MSNSEIITQYDSVTPSTIPSNAVAVAGYVGGSFPDFSELVALFPHARHKSVAVNASEDADILDIENGDAVPGQAPSWFSRQKARGLELPGVYADASTMPSVVAAMTAAGIAESEYVRWVAWLGSTEIPAGMNARQYTFTAFGRNLDASVCFPSFWGTTPSPPVKNTVRYDWFPTGPFVVNRLKLDERSVVERYDKLRQDAKKHRVQLAILRLHLKWLADRVYAVAHKRPGKPTWGLFHRGWRYQQLIHRSQGQRFV